MEKFRNLTTIYFYLFHLDDIYNIIVMKSVADLEHTKTSFPYKWIRVLFIGV